MGGYMESKKRNENMLTILSHNMQLILNTLFMESKLQKIIM